VVQVQQRDAEVAVLMRLLPGAPPNLQQLIAAQLQQQQQQQVVGGKGSPAKPGPPAGSDRDAAAVRDAAMAAVGTPAAAGGGGEGAGGKQEQVLSALLDVNLLADRHRAFEVFRKSYRQNEVRGGSWRAGWGMGCLHTFG
jgi:kinesin family protein 6/9